MLCGIILAFHWGFFIILLCQLVLKYIIIVSTSTGGVAIVYIILSRFLIRHLTQLFLVHFQLNLLVLMLIYGWLYENPMIYQAFGFHGSGQPAAVGLVIVMYYVLSPYNAVVKLIMAALYRSQVSKADHFVQKLGKEKALQNALIHLNVNNLSFPVNDHLYSIWYNVHPQLQDRLAALTTKKE